MKKTRTFLSLQEEATREYNDFMEGVRGSADDNLTSRSLKPAERFLNKKIQSLVKKLEKKKLRDGVRFTPYFRESLKRFSNILKKLKKKKDAWTPSTKEGREMRKKFDKSVKEFDKWAKKRKL